MSLRSLDGLLAVRSEGGLLPADLLQRIVGGDREIEGLDPQRNYHLAGGERLNEAVSRSWQRLLGAWRTFRSAAGLLEPRDAATTLTRERWLLVLFHELGYGRLSTSKAVSIEGREYPISHMWQRVPIHLVGCQVEIDKRTPGVAGAARTTPHGLVQDFLNRSRDHLWGFVSNGLRLRILRDNARLARQAYVEFDVESIFENELFPDFGLMWLLCHQSRVEEERPEACWLEHWREFAATQGTRALDTLRDGVEAALSALGRGFLAHPGNAPLKTALRSGTLSTQDYYRELLRLVYRQLFLFVAEDRDLLHPRDASATGRQRYLSHYSSRRLRELAQRMRGSGHADLFRMFEVVVAGLSADEGCPALGLPALGGLLWSDRAAPHLDAAELANRDWLEAVRALAYTKQDGVLRPVDWRNLGSTELGSIYESLLELHPDVNADAAAFSLSSGAGSERKTSGSYYTPDSLVQCLLDSALDPVLAQAGSGPDPERAMLRLKVCDPACGSGHFLIAAAHRIARRLARVRTGDDEPAPEASRTALRDVVGRCLYGVDLNPMAAELCKVNLWLEGMEPGKPLSFLDHHIQVGNSLLGTTPDLIAQDIPDGAFEPIEGDDKKTCAALRKRNRLERDGQQDMLHLMVAEPRAAYSSLADQAGALDGIDDSGVAGVLEKELRFQRLVESATYRHAKLVADACCAAFVWGKAPGGRVPGCITTDVLRRLKADATALTPAEVTEVQRLAASYRFFHWHLAFSEVFARGGFDVILGNPPWERVKLQEKEWFAERRPDIADAPNSAARKRLIEGLRASPHPADVALCNEFNSAVRTADGHSHILRDSGLYPLCGRGDVNTFAVFAELSRKLIGTSGYAGCVLPLGIVADDTTKDFFRDLVEKQALVSVFGFINERMLFPQVLHNFKFCILTVAGQPHRLPARFVFNCYNVDETNDPERWFNLSPQEILLLNPETGTCPTFFFRRSAELTLAIYRRLPILASIETGWRIELFAMLHMGEASGLFATSPKPDYLPVYEAKMIHQFNHRFASYHLLAEGERSHMLPEVPLELLRDPSFSPTSCYYCPAPEVQARLNGRTDRKWIVASRRITSAGLYRTCIYAIMPFAGASDSMTLVSIPDASPRRQAALVAAFNSFAFDFVTRQKQAGANLSFFVKRQLPIIPVSAYEAHPPWAGSQTVEQWLSERALELTYTAWDLEAFAQDCGWLGPPFRWDEERRFLLRCELDATFFHLFLGPENEWRKQPESLTAAFPTPRHAVDYVMGTFPIVKRKDEATHGEYRTKRVVLEIYDEMQQAMDTGRPYQTRLDPPPADSRVAYESAAVGVPPEPAVTTVMPFRSLGRKPRFDERYVKAVPLRTLKAAAGAFGNEQDPEIDDWVEVRATRPLKKGMFVAKVDGKSMTPLIPDGAYCLFQTKPPQVTNGTIWLVQLHAAEDPEHGGRYTVKRLAVSTLRDGEEGRRRSVTLVPENSTFEPIAVEGDNVKLVAEFVEVLQPLGEGGAEN